METLNRLRALAQPGCRLMQLRVRLKQIGVNLLVALPDRVLGGHIQHRQHLTDTQLVDAIGIDEAEQHRALGPILGKSAQRIEGKGCIYGPVGTGRQAHHDTHGVVGRGHRDRGQFRVRILGLDQRVYIACADLLPVAIAVDRALHGIALSQGIGQRTLLYIVARHVERLRAGLNRLVISAAKQHHGLTAHSKSILPVLIGRHLHHGNVTAQTARRSLGKRCVADVDQRSGQTLRRGCLQSHQIRPDRIDRVRPRRRTRCDVECRSTDRRNHNRKLMLPDLNTGNSAYTRQKPVRRLIMPHGAGRPRGVAGQPRRVTTHAVRKIPTPDRTGSDPADGYGKKQSHACVSSEHQVRLPCRPSDTKGTDA